MIPAISTRTAIVFVGALALYTLSSGIVHPTVYNNYALLADAFRHGRVWIYQPSGGIDALEYLGRYYIIEAPMPAVLMLPLVLFSGTDANQTLAAVICAAVLVAAMDVVLGRMAIGETTRRWVVIFCAAGTVLWWCASFPAVWMFAHITGAMFLTLALAEFYGRRRPWLVGLLLACAALSRFPTVLAALPLAVWLFADSPPLERLRRIGSMMVGAAPLFLLYAAYNYARWHTVSDIGYTLWYHQDQVGQPTGSPFRLEYLPFNLYSFFLLPPQYDQTFPWIHPTGMGVCLTLTSPALVLAFAAGRSRETLSLWIAVVLVAIPSALYYVNGFEQFGMRHAMDFLPPLLMLCALGIERCPRSLSAALIAWSIAANAYGEWYSWAYHAFTVVPTS
jgi:hypothetical protein